MPKGAEPAQRKRHDQEDQLEFGTQYHVRAEHQRSRGGRKQDSAELLPTMKSKKNYGWDPVYYINAANV